ncbi:MAG: AlwI family type II restriction endonuclease [Bacillota bacterium]
MDKKISQKKVSKERPAEHKPLSFSTTMRNPQRIAGFLNCVLPYEGEVLTNSLIIKIIKHIIGEKLYTPMYVKHSARLKEIFISDAKYSNEELDEIILNSDQNHKEAGFDKGWPSRFDTMYKLPMEFGFVYYAMNEPLIISNVGHMLIDAFNESPQNDEKIQNVFLNSLMKYQTNNPFRKNANINVPLLLLLNTIKELKNYGYDNGVFTKEISLFICWRDSNYKALAKFIHELRCSHGYTYSDDTIYDICLKILGADHSKSKRFKLEQITGEAIDEYIRKMRITGVISLRGNGRFLDTNTFEEEKIQYIVDKYSVSQQFASKKEYFDYIGQIDYKIISIKQKIVDNLSELKIKALEKWAVSLDKELVLKELAALDKKRGCSNEVLRVIDRPTRLEFLTSIALKQAFPTVTVLPNYNIDDEGFPTFTAAGGMADIECFDADCNPLFEVTLMTSRSQSTNEIPAITRHLNEAITKYPDKKVFTVFIAPSIHEDTKFMAGYSKHQYGVDIIPLAINDCIDCIKNSNRLINMLM